MRGIGGCFFLGVGGGAGRLWMIAVGAIAMQELQTGINMVLGSWSGSAFASNFVWGVLLIAVLGFSTWLSHRKRDHRTKEVEEALDAESSFYDHLSKSEP
ncbi:hypothetical protein M3B90_02640 [Dermabacter sp. p3-SID358]|uniref:hypothetical protein n=1 Tax=Dermabacter sp. p3-SID358 TaxID=2916114 RepID=UPI0021A5032A|nr:hypothetical protein [Dermabacter sp. p3-SID358]MCT1866424.1 hypothetical protein [Dermabacter sp. p3-SID358]